MDDAHVDPAILRRYELENQVGKGSYGVVWSVSFLRSASAQRSLIGGFVFASSAHLLIYIFPIDPIFSGQGQTHWRASCIEEVFPMF